MKVGKPSIGTLESLKYILNKTTIVKKQIAKIKLFVSLLFLTLIINFFTPEINN
jgi:hypothetical protein